MATKHTVSVVWMESRQQWLAKSTEYYNGKIFKVVGYSRLGKTEARKAWKRNYEKKIASMEAKEACRDCKVRFEEAIQEWYNPSLPLVNVKWSLFSAPFPCIYAVFPVFMRAEIF